MRSVSTGSRDLISVDVHTNAIHCVLMVLQAPKRRPTRTIENTREFDETVVDPDDEEVEADEATDALASYFDGTPPKILITTSTNAVKVCTGLFLGSHDLTQAQQAKELAEILADLIPSARYVPRKVLSRYPYQLHLIITR